MIKMEKEKIVYETPSTKEVLLKMERCFMGTNDPGYDGEKTPEYEGEW